INCGDCTDTKAYGIGGGIATGCLDLACRAMLTVGAGLAVPAHGDNYAPVLTGGLMLGTRIGRGITDVAPLGEHAYGFAGARFGGAQFAIDAGAAVAVERATQVTPMLGVAGRL